MPQTPKLSAREESSSETEEPGIGARSEAKLSAESASAEAETKPQPAEGASQEVAQAAKETPSPEGATSEPTEEKSKPAFPDFFGDGAETFADKIAASLERAGAPLENKDRSEEQSGDAKDERDGDPEPTDEGEGFFSGWDDLDEIQELNAEQEIADEREADKLEDEPQPRKENLGRRTLTDDMSLASALGASPEFAHDHAGLSSKHDELADAVQSALNSIYGGASLPLPSRPDSSAYSPEPHAAGGSGWGSEDHLSPQDVILNYFSYDSRTGGGSTYPGHLNGTARDAVDEPTVFAGYRPERQRFDPEPRQGSYDGPASYPVPAGYNRPPKAAASERESNRLLGAAAIGLVGGIAIAASLAVFVISSYGPGAAVAPDGAANRPADNGYGRWLRGEESDLSKTAAATRFPEATAVISAGDVLASPGQPSPLAIEVKQDRASEQTLVSITGVPEGVRLNSGVDAGGGNWLLPPGRVNGLTINLPPGTRDGFLLGVQLLDSNLRTPLSEKKQFAVRLNAPKPPEPMALNAPKPEPLASVTVAPRPSQPAPLPETPAQSKFAPPSFSTETVAAPAVPAPQAQQQTPSLAAPQASAARQPALPAQSATKGTAKAEIEDLIREGNKRMREGDILEARQLYQKAVALGDPEAALAMGRSYDPIYFARIDRRNAEPDAAKAFDWYRRAMDGGAGQTAKVRIENLKHFLNE